MSAKPNNATCCVHKEIFSRVVFWHPHVQQNVDREQGVFNTPAKVIHAVVDLDVRVEIFLKLSENIDRQNSHNQDNARNVEFVLALELFPLLRLELLFV